MLTSSVKKLVGASILAATISTGAHAQSNGDTFVHLFEWDWDDIGRECIDYLGPKGYKAVQVPPPQEHVSQDPNAVDPNAWWVRYQPMSYSIAQSRSGTGAQFQQMVTDCNSVGVDIYVDAVINHMAGDGGNGVASSMGRFAQENNYPAVPYGPSDFNNCGKPEIEGIDYSNEQNGGSAFNVRHCDLVGLDDLATGSSNVRTRIINFLNGLTAMGVKGYRIDAAKHMEPADIQFIINNLNPIAGTNDPVYIFQEVIDKVPGSEAIRATEYTFADVTEFQWAENIGKKFQGLFENEFQAFGKLADLETIGSPAWNMLPSDKAVIFVSNHDDQRGGGRGAVVDFNDEPGLNFIAEVYQLAQPYGYPKVMSSYYFLADEDRSIGRPLTEGPDSLIGGCEAPYGPNRGGTEGWVCEHRWAGIANMVAFRKAAANQPLTNWWDNGSNQIAFGRNGKGFLAINHESFPLNETLQTGMPDGDYCDILSGEFEAGSCTGNVVTVSGGQISINLTDRNSALAIHSDAKIGGTPTNWYFRGTANNWGASLMTDIGSDQYEITVTFASGDANGGPRFKIADTNNWTGSAYPAEDFLVTDGAGEYVIVFDASTTSIVSVTKQGGGGDSWYFRGTANNWGSSLMTDIGSNQYEITVNFGSGDANGGPRFKIADTTDWSGSAYPAQDFQVTDGPGEYVVVFDASTNTIASVTKQGGTGSTWYFRGTPNTWGTSLMTSVGSNQYEITVTFGSGDGNGGPRFKIADTTDWTGSAFPAQDYQITQGAGQYSIVFNEATSQIVSVTKL